MSTGPEFYRQTLHPSTATSPDGSQKEKREVVLATKCELQDVTELRDFRGQDREVCLTSHYFLQIGSKRNRGAFGEYSVILRRTIKKESPNITEITFEIQSESLRKEFRELVTDSAAGIVDLAADPIMIEQPFKLLFHSRDKIQNYANKSPELTKEMKLVADFLEDNEELRETQKMYEQLWPRKKTNYPLLWTIYRPGELVVLSVRGITELWLFQRAFETCDSDGNRLWAVCGRGIDYDGTRLGLVERRMDIPIFAGIIDIESLSVIPLDAYPEKYREELKKRMTDRGKQFEQLLASRHCSYEGPVWVPSPKKNQQPSMIPGLQVNERVMVDYVSFLDKHQHHRPSLLPKPRKPAAGISIGSTQESIATLMLPDSIASEPSSPLASVNSAATKPTVKDENSLTNDEYLLCPARIPGFSLGQKEWGYFLVEGLKEVQWREGAFDLLEMDERKKNLVRALIQGHKQYGTDDNDTFDDIVKGKGNGLVFMLHGPPGLGKTLMAESISEHSKRPLYQISSGELTTNVPTMERAIKSIFKHGRKWNAIVLLDEADVLMSDRNEGNLESNTMVSVFLRLIEYYEGILFLTTNRPTHFDEAIYNRVHLTLAFEALTPAVRQRIWRNILNQNFKSPNKLPESWTEDIFKVLGNFDVNGRTIKNLLRTASCYAHSEGKPLGVEYLNEVMQVNLAADVKKSSEFMKHLDLLDQEVKKLQGGMAAKTTGLG